MARIIGIDLGHYAVRLAVLEGSFGRFQFSRLIEVEVPPHAPEAVDAARLTALSAARAQLGAGGPDTWGACFPAERTSVRIVTLPFVDRAQIEKTLPFEVEGLVPFDLDEMILADRVLSSENNESRVLCALAPKASLQAALAGLATQSIDPKHLLLDTDLYDGFATEGVQAIIDLGYSRTLISLCRNGQVVGSRGIDRGARDLVWEVAIRLSLTVPEAEAAVRAVGISGQAATGAWGVAEVNVDLDDDGWTEEEPTGATRRPNVLPKALNHPSGQVEAIVRDALLPLVTELRASLISFEDALKLSIDEVLVAGAGSALPGLRDLLVESLGVPVRPVSVPEAAGKPVPERFALALALAHRTATGKGRHIDFRKRELAFKGDLTALGNLLRYGAVAAAALLLAGIGYFGWQYSKLQSEISDVEATLAETVLQAVPDADPERLKDPSLATAIMSEKAQETTSRVEALGGIVSNEPPTLTLLLDLATSVPPHTETKMDVTELSVATATITMKIDTTGFEAAANIESALQRSPRFKAAKKSDEKKNKDGVRFSITIPMAGEEAQEG